MNRFEGRAVLVTGAGSGMGQATVERLLVEGAAVAGLDRRVDGVPGGALPIECDVSDEAAVAAAVDRAVAELGRLDGVATVAGVFRGGDMRPAAEVELDDFLLVLRVNLVGTWLVVKHAMPALLAAEGRGAVVTVASTAAVSGHGQGSGYTASKGGVTALTRLLAVQYGPRGVRANCVCPGSTDTPMTLGVYQQADMVERMRRSVPLGRVGQAAEQAATIAFLLSDDASYLNGATLVVDGGVTVA
jgi:NAD(P)-dependent dehydrogenase (short-subunit alcohol dehydrogenase family)